jgi:hypothetical protein
MTAPQQSTRTPDTTFADDETPDGQAADRLPRDSQDPDRETPQADVSRSDDENAEPVRAPSDGQLPPDATDGDPVAALWGVDLIARYRERWQQLQLAFVDNPQAATGDAAALLEDAVNSLTSTLTSQKQSLDGWQAHGNDDTEVLRTALQRYREFLDRLLGM